MDDEGENPDPRRAQSSRRASALALVIGVAGALVVLLLVEGIASLAAGREPAPSLVSRAIELFDPDPLSRFAAPEPMLTDPSELEALLPSLRAHFVGMGNSPYEELKTDDASVNHVVDGCLELRPNLAKRTTFLRTPLFERFNPITAFVDSDRALPPDLSDFLERYALRWVDFTTNEFGERTTMPHSDASRIAIVAGDSVAFGAMLSDDETLASLLQAQDGARRYVNIGVGGADADDVVCAMRRAGERYRQRVDALVYVYCENDFHPEDPMGTPEEVMLAVRDFAAQHEIDDVTVVYMPYIFNVVPDLTRIRGERGGRMPDHAQERQRLTDLVRESGFGWVDFTEIALAEAIASHTRFAALALYLDVVHLSPLGATRMADAVRSVSVGTTRREDERARAAIQPVP